MCVIWMVGNRLFLSENWGASRDSISDVNVADDHQVSRATGVSEPITPLTTDMRD